MIIVDEICREYGLGLRSEWLDDVAEKQLEIVEFVNSRLEWEGKGELVGSWEASFNFCVCMTLSGGEPDVLIRFPKLGDTVTAMRDEKVANEVAILKHIQQHTTIPVPRVLDWGLAKDDPLDLGPFIIMEFISGTRLSSILEEPRTSQSQDVVLDPEVDRNTLDILYDQLTDYMIQLSELDFDAIGSVSHNAASDTWRVTGRPFTSNMNELVTLAGYPRSSFPAQRFTSNPAYLQNLVNEHWGHLVTQRNLASCEEDVYKVVTARYQFMKLCCKYGTDDKGPFKIFSDSLQPSNILVDPESLQINGIIDWGFTNAMPAQFAHDPPWWLLLEEPGTILERSSLQEFLEQYEPRLKQFLRAMERVETQLAHESTARSSTPLSALMRESWDTRCFWFNYGMRKSFYIDTIYWSVFHEGALDHNLLDEELRGRLKTIKVQKMKERGAYDEECKNRLD